jgi:hypothetical protein
MKRKLPPELEAAVLRARARAEANGEVPTSRRGAGVPAMPAEAAAFVKQILSDGSYAEAVRQLGSEDPEIATA